MQAAEEMQPLSLVLVVPIAALKLGLGVSVNRLQEATMMVY